MLGQKRKKQDEGGCREVQGVQGCLGGVQGVPGGVLGGSRGFGRKNVKTRKTRKTLRNCMASLLRSDIQDFVQEVPAGQMARVPPFGACRGPPPPLYVGGGKGGG